LKRWTIVSNVLAFVTVVGVSWWIVSLVQRSNEKIEAVRAVVENQTTTWASISEYHAAWKADTKQVWQSMLFQRNEDCLDTPIVLKEMRLVNSSNEVVGAPIAINGHINQQMATVSKGNSAHLFDLANPRRQLTPPGKYLISLVAMCEQVGVGDKPIVLRSFPVSASITVTNE
jgi:hypothetical protein